MLTSEARFLVNDDHNDFGHRLRTRVTLMVSYVCANDVALLRWFAGQLERDAWWHLVLPVSPNHWIRPTP